MPAATPLPLLPVAVTAAPWEKPLAVAMLIWDYWPGRQGGAQRQCRQLAQSLARLGINVRVVSQRQRWFETKQQIDGTIGIVRLGRFSPLAAVAMRLSQWKLRWLADPAAPAPGGRRRSWGATTPLWLAARRSFIKAATAYLRKQRGEIDLIHVHEANWLAGFAAWIGGQVGVPVVCKAATLPSLPEIGCDAPQRRLWRQWRPQQHFIALNETMAGELHAAGIGGERITVIPNGVVVPAEPADPGREGCVLHLSRFSNDAGAKSHAILLRAWSLVHRQLPAARLLLAGYGDRRPWRALAAKLGCGDSLSLLGFTDEPESLFRQASVFVLPSQREGMSNALLEALSWGLPAVASDIPGNRALVRHEHNGLLVPAGDAEALARALVRLLLDPGLRVRLGVAGRRLVQDRFALDAVTGRVLELYVRLAAREKSNEFKS